MPKKRIDEVLVEMGLAERAKDKFSTYSLGMKQRLALAGALLTDPELLIFDEPTNGLDPAGIREIRKIMVSLADAGKTVLVSSHILAEIELIADTVSIIGNGKLLAEGRLADILDTGEKAMRLGVNDPNYAAQLLTNAGYLVKTAAERHLLVSNPEHPAELTSAKILSLLEANGLELLELTPVQANLEAVFMALTDDEAATAEILGR